MKILAASIIMLALSASAFADAPARPDVVKIRFAIRDATTTATSTFDVMVMRSGADRCASARGVRPDRTITLTACVVDASHLRVDWSVKGPGGEYHSTSSLAITHGATTELGDKDGVRLAVTIQ